MILAVPLKTFTLSVTERSSKQLSFINRREELNTYTEPNMQDDNIIVGSMFK